MMQTTWSPSSSALSFADDSDCSIKPKGPREENKQGISVDCYQVRLRVLESGSVEVHLRYFRSSPDNAEKFSLTSLQSEIEHAFPQPLSPDQRSVVEVWQARAVEQAETIRRLRWDLDKARFHQDNAEDRCAEFERQLSSFESRQMSFEGLHGAIVPTTSSKKEIVQLQQEVKFLTNALSQSEQDLFHANRNWTSLNATLLEEIDMHRSVQHSMKQLLLEVHHIDYEDAGKAVVELQTQRLVLLEKLTHALRESASETSRADSLLKQVSRLEDRNQQLHKELGRFTANPTVTGLVEYGVLDR